MLQQCCQLLEDRLLKVAFIESASSGYLTSQFSIHKIVVLIFYWVG